MNELTGKGRCTWAIGRRAIDTIRLCVLFFVPWLPFFTQDGSTNAQTRQDPNERFHQATEAMKQGRLDEAATGFAAATKASPTFAEAHLNLGLVLEEQGKNEEAVASLQKALKLKPRLRGANLFLGIAQYRLNRFDAATASLKKETAYFPSSPDAWMWLGVVQLASEQPDDAVQSLDRAYKLAPDNVDILYNRGRAHLLVSKNSYGKMYKANPDSWHVHQVLAQAYAESDRHEEAIAEYQVAIRQAPSQPGLHEELGSEYLRAGNLDAAEAEFSREIALDPKNAFALFKLGATQVEKGEPEKGKQSIESAMQENPRLKNAPTTWVAPKCSWVAMKKPLIR
jgi:tetratricopeptide (TPR) repeat protein